MPILYTEIRFCRSAPYMLAPFVITSSRSGQFDVILQEPLPPAFLLLLFFGYFLSGPSLSVM